MNKTNPYTGLPKEDLQFLLDHPNEIETGCERNSEEALEGAKELIREAIKLL